MKVIVSSIICFVILLLAENLKILWLGILLILYLILINFSKSIRKININSEDKNLDTKINPEPESINNKEKTSSDSLLASVDKTIKETDDLLNKYRVDYLKVVKRNTSERVEYVLTGICSELNKDFDSIFTLVVYLPNKDTSILGILFNNQLHKESQISLETFSFSHSLFHFKVLDYPIKLWKNNQYEYIFAIEENPKTNFRIYNNEKYYQYDNSNIYVVKDNFWRKSQILYWLLNTGEFSTTGTIVFINKIGTIDIIIDESIRLYGTEKRGCKVLPVDDRLPDFIRFGIVEGNFYFNNSGWNSIKNIENNYEGGEILPHTITTLDGCPEIVKGDFKCAGLGLTTLVGGPKEVDGNYIAKNNSLVTLEGMALKIGGDFDISNNELTDSAWEYAQLNIPSEVGGSCKIRGNRFIKYIGNKI